MIGIENDNYTIEDKVLTEVELCCLENQNSRLVSDFMANKFEIEAKKYWDLFYKRNETRFFKDRHWTTREFHELLNASCKGKKLLEIGCGVGNLIFPLFKESTDLFFYACDLSPRAVGFIKSNPLYDEKRMLAFQADIITDEVFNTVESCSIDIVTLIFVLSAIHPDNFKICVKNIFKLLKPGGVVLFRDYGLYDMAQLRFKAGHKISENFYVRQDGTRSYYFSVKVLEDIFTSVGFKVVTNNYVHRQTVNKKEGVNVQRTFVQAKMQKP